MDLQGKVFNELGNLYSGTLTVTLYNDDTGATIAGVTNPVTTSNGTWSFTGLTNTVKYRVEVASGNYKRIIVPGKVQHIDLQLTGNLDVNGTSNLAGNVTVGGNIVMAAGATVDGVDVSELAASVATDSELAAHAANANAHHNKVHNHTSTAEGGTLNLLAESFVPVGDAVKGDGFASSTVGWVYYSARYPTSAVFTAEYLVHGGTDGNNAFGTAGIYDITAGSIVYSESYSNLGSSSEVHNFVPVNGHKYGWFRNCSTNGMGVTGQIVAHWA
jgi:hypothetical protein